MRMLQLIDTAMLAAKVASVGYEQYGLQGSPSPEESCPDEPLGEVYNFFHTIKDFHVRFHIYQLKIIFTAIMMIQKNMTMFLAVSHRIMNQSIPCSR